LQESFVTIAQDNTYYYNTTFSKQNRENTFTHLPPDWEEKLCFTNYPFRAIYSDVQNIDADNRVNNWLIYRAVSYFDFPQNYGNLVSLDGIQNRAVLARFENKTLMYNNLLTIDTSNPQAAYIGNPTMFRGAPPIDFAETDLGYIGSQHRFLMKIPQGQITVDAKRGQVFLISGTEAVDLSAFGSGMNRFFVEHLPFMIYKSFPQINIDNHFNGFGLHGVYDSVYDRVILTKIDYAPNPEYKDKIKYDAATNQFYIEEEIVIPTTTTTTTTVLEDMNKLNCSNQFNNSESWINEGVTVSTAPNDSWLFTVSVGGAVGQFLNTHTFGQDYYFSVEVGAGITDFTLVVGAGEEFIQFLNITPPVSGYQRFGISFTLPAEVITFIVAFFITSPGDIILRNAQVNEGSTFTYYQDKPC
jgi:hypothetical protein